MHPYVISCLCHVIVNLICWLSAPPQFSGLYLISLVVILIGFVTFNAVPTPTNPTDPDTSSSSPSICEEGYDNPVEIENDVTRKEVAVRIPNVEDREDEQQGYGDREDGWEEKEKSASGASQSYEDDKDLAVGQSTKM